MKSSFFLIAAALGGSLAWSQAAPAAAPKTAVPQPPSSTGAPAASSASALHARGPEAVAQQNPDKVVATLGGKPLTAKQAADLLRPVRPEDRKRYEQNLAALIQQIYLTTQLAGQATTMKLDQQSPWKEQLDLARDNILTQAYLAKKSEGGLPDSKAYYDSHVADFDQIKLSGILVGFNPPGTPASSNAAQRTEAQAQEKVTDLEKKIKAGGDFAALARTDSDHQSSAKGGEIGTFLLADTQLPADVKAVVSKMQTGQVSEPVRVNGGFFIFKVDNRTKIPYEQVQAGIVQKLQNERIQIVLKQETEKYNIQVQDPDFFNSSTGTAPSLRVPSLAHPGSTTATPPAPAPTAPPK